MSLFAKELPLNKKKSKHFLVLLGILIDLAIVVVVNECADRDDRDDRLCGCGVCVCAWMHLR